MDRFLAERGSEAIDPSVVLQCPIARLQLPTGPSNVFAVFSLDAWAPIHYWYRVKPLAEHA